MAITPETVKNRKFPIRLKGYDIDEVRAFLDEVAGAYRAVIRDGGTELALATVSDDMASVLRATHSAAESVVSSAEAEAAQIRTNAKADAAAARDEAEAQTGQTTADAAVVAADARRAKELLDDAGARAEEIVAEAQDAAVQILDDVEAVTNLREQLRAADKKRATAAQQYHETEQAAEEIVAVAKTQAERVRADADDYAAQQRREAVADREQARIEVERAAEEGRVEADKILAAATEGARVRVEEALAEGQARLEAVARNESILQERLEAAQQELREIMSRLDSSRTIDLTEDDSVLVYQGVHRGTEVPGGTAVAGGTAPADDTDTATQDMVSTAVGRAVERSLGSGNH